MTLSVLLFGFLLGMKHALEADHVAAVASLASRSSSLREHLGLAGLWGIGHALTLGLVGAAVVLLGLTLPRALADGFEGLVGLVLIGLGVDVMRRLRRRHVHFHVHRHGDGPPHLHAHAHAEHAVHDADRHHHHHVRSTGLRALLVGGLHGLAGSAALVLLSAEATQSTGQALLYVAVFGFGSIAGMMTLSLAISIPLRLSVDGLGRFRHGLEGALGTTTIALGVWMAFTALTVG